MFAADNLTASKTKAQRDEVFCESHQCAFSPPFFFSFLFVALFSTRMKPLLRLYKHADYFSLPLRMCVCACVCMPEDCTAQAAVLPESEVLGQGPAAHSAHL